MVHDSQYDTLEKRLQPPTDAKFSVVMNSVGNGMMLGAAPFILAESISGITGKAIPGKLHWVNAILTTVGLGWGYMSGQKEFVRLQNYRQAVSNEILKLNDHIVANDTEIKSWTDKVKKPVAEHDEGIAR